MGREQRILELKAEVDALRARAGEPPRYPSGALGSAADPTQTGGGEQEP